MKLLQTVLHIKAVDDTMWLISSLQIHDGVVIYVCFYKGATEKIIPKMGKYSERNDSIS